MTVREYVVAALHGPRHVAMAHPAMEAGLVVLSWSIPIAPKPAFCIISKSTFCQVVDEAAGYILTTLWETSFSNFDQRYGSPFLLFFASEDGEVTSRSAIVNSVTLLGPKYKVEWTKAHNHVGADPRSAGDGVPKP